MATIEVAKRLSPSRTLPLKSGPGLPVEKRIDHQTNMIFIFQVGIEQRLLRKFKVLQGKIESIRLALSGPGEVLDVVGSNILGWTVANSAWLLATRVQLQPSVLMVLLRDPVEFWPSG